MIFEELQVGQCYMTDGNGKYNEDDGTGVFMKIDNPNSDYNCVCLKMPNCGIFTVGFTYYEDFDTNVILHIGLV